MTLTKNAPSWDLTDFYKDFKDPQIAADLKESKGAIQQFVAAYEGKLQSLTAPQLYEAVGTYESIREKISKVGCYSFLVFAADMSPPEVKSFFQTTQEEINLIYTNLLFFTLEVADLEVEHLEALFAEHGGLARYRPWFREVTAFRPHQLPKVQEQLMHEISIASHSNWVRLHEELLSSFLFPYGETETLPISQILNHMVSADPAVRKAAALGFAKGLEQNSLVLTMVYNTLVKEKEIEDKWRHFKAPIASRNLANMVEDEVVEALIQTVKDSYQELSHRYYGLKAKWMGLSKMPYWDRNAPLPGEPARVFTWQEAQDLVLAAYHDFSPPMAEIGKKFFDHGWIDAALRPGKDSGAFSAATVPQVHPYILLNFHGKPRDVMTLAHELGHGVHQWLSREQGFLMADTPLTIAETASVFGEMLTFQKLLKESTPQDKKNILAQKVEDMLNTVVRQIAFCLFEKEVHAARAKKELSAQELGAIWISTQKEALGPVFDIHEESYQYYWSYVSHFIHTPFYVYAYAFGDCLVNSLYATYQKGFPNFEQTYLRMLQAGGSMTYHELLKLFELDAKDPSFWRDGLKVISGMIDTLETLE